MRRVGAIRAWSFRHRGVIVSIAAVAYLAGMAVSVGKLGLEWESLSIWPLVLICVLGVPISLVLNAVELQLCARAVGRRLGLRQALAVTTTGTISNLLPVPASFAIRGGALVAAGAGLREAGVILVVAGLLWLTLALAVTGLSVALTSWVGVVLAAIGVAGTVGLTLWIDRRSTTALALGFGLVRAFLLVVLVGRLWLSFMAIDASVTLVAAAYYAVAGIAGTAVAVVPAGLGVSEGFAAVMAGAIGASPSAAFLALGLNRVLGLLFCGGVAGWLWTRTVERP